MPHKYWGMSSLTYIIEHIDFISWWRGWESTNRRNTGIYRDMDEKGNKKGNNPVQIADFSQTPPGVAEPGGGCVGAPLYLSNLFPE
jgi:hypothetical protein